MRRGLIAHGPVLCRQATIPTYAIDSSSMDLGLVLGKRAANSRTGAKTESVLPQMIDEVEIVAVTAGFDGRSLRQLQKMRGSTDSVLAP
ncbi:hypothetical protein MKK65_18600, partial [Methylobacterium sp. J-001]|nr:hypothetical protein [Methylobacterium sp. J-001]